MPKRHRADDGDSWDKPDDSESWDQPDCASDEEVDDEIWTPEKAKSFKSTSMMAELGVGTRCTVLLAQNDVLQHLLALHLLQATPREAAEEMLSCLTELFLQNVIKANTLCELCYWSVKMGELIFPALLAKSQLASTVHICIGMLRAFQVQRARSKTSPWRQASKVASTPLRLFRTVELAHSQPCSFALSF